MNMGQEERTTKRRYRMTTRAEATEATRERILDAATALFWEQPLDVISLEVVAHRAGVSLPTVIRHYGDWDGLFAACVERETLRITSQRDKAPTGDVRGAIRALCGHYEELGDAVLRLLAVEERSPALRRVADSGRATHVAWCERVFARPLARLSGHEHARRLAELISLTDVYVWKLLRRDRQLSPSEAELAIFEMAERLIGE